MVMLLNTGEDCTGWVMNFLPQLGEELTSAEDVSYMHSLVMLLEQFLDPHVKPLRHAACSGGENAKPGAFLRIRAASKRGDGRSSLPPFTVNRDRFSWTRILDGDSWHWIAVNGECLLLRFRADAPNRAQGTWISASGFESVEKYLV